MLSVQVEIEIVRPNMGYMMRIRWEGQLNRRDKPDIECHRWWIWWFRRDIDHIRIVQSEVELSQVDMTRTVVIQFGFGIVPVDMSDMLMLLHLLLLFRLDMGHMLFFQGVLGTDQLSTGCSLLHLHMAVRCMSRRGMHRMTRRLLQMTHSLEYSWDRLIDQLGPCTDQQDMIHSQQLTIPVLGTRYQLDMENMQLDQVLIGDNLPDITHMMFVLMQVERNLSRKDHSQCCLMSWWTCRPNMMDMMPVRRSRMPYQESTNHMLRRKAETEMSQLDMQHTGWGLLCWHMNQVYMPHMHVLVVLMRLYR
jgi:hypothetical protein